MIEREEFYRLRDCRTVNCGGDPSFFDVPVGLTIGRRTASTGAGQIALLSLVNMLARVHRRLVLDVPETELVVPAPFLSVSSLREAALRTAAAVDPYCSIERLTGPTGVVSLGVGDDVPTGLRWYVGGTRSTAHLREHPMAIHASSGTFLGAGLAACLGAAALFKEVHRMPVVPGSVSVWDVAETSDPTGPVEIGPLDVGNLAMVGAGAVGSALAYWTSFRGHRGEWAVIDHDVVELHNTNRGLGMLPVHAGWPTGGAIKKAQVAAFLVEARAFPVPYERWLAEDPDARPDVILPLANGPGLRSAVNRRGEPFLLHATTSRSWQSQLHRHIPYYDDCIECRLPDQAQPRFRCSTGSGRLSTNDSHAGNDAALPFLSGAAGILLLAALYRLQHGQLCLQEGNLSAIDFNSTDRIVRSYRFRCNGDCRSVLPAKVRRTLNAGRKWAHLDTQSSTLI